MPRVRLAWIHGGSQPPLYTPEISGIARAMAIKLQFLDNRERKVYYYVIIVYHSGSGRSQDEHGTFLESLSDLYAKSPEKSIIVSGEDINVKLRKRNLNYSNVIHDRAGHIGPFGTQSQPNDRYILTLDLIK